MMGRAQVRCVQVRRAQTRPFPLPQVSGDTASPLGGQAVTK